MHRPINAPIIARTNESSSRRNRIPSLDGLRAISVALVVCGHAYQGATGSSPNTTLWLILGNSALGVEVFFVISGYIITTLLLDEYSLNKTIKCSHFYLRRAFRILPALWAYIIVVLLLWGLGLLRNVDQCSVISAITFTTNYIPCADSNAFAHIWSLSIEEQYYLLWPGVLLLILRNWSTRVAIQVALVLVVISPIIRVITYSFGNEFLAGRLYYTLHTRLDALMFGCLIALVSGTTTFERLYYSARQFVIPAALTAFILSPLATNHFGGAYIYTIGYTIEGASIAIIIVWLVRNSRSVVGKILNSPPIVYVGNISYSLYLWQQLFFKTELGFAEDTGLALLIAFSVSAASFALVEKPFLQIRYSLTTRRTERIASTIAMQQSIAKVGDFKQRKF